MLALLKQQGGGVKGMSKGSPVNEEVPPLLEAGGKIEVCQPFALMLISWYYLVNICFAYINTFQII